MSPTSSATSDRTVTRLSATSTKPSCTAAFTSSPSEVRMVTAPIPRLPMNGACPVMKAISPSVVRAITMWASPL